MMCGVNVTQFSMFMQGALDAGHVATRLPGSTTACVVRLNQDVSTISAANLVRRLLPATDLERPLQLSAGLPGRLKCTWMRDSK